MMAAAGDVTVVDVEHLFFFFDMECYEIYTPGIFVQRIVHAPDVYKAIEKRTVRPKAAA